MPKKKMTNIKVGDDIGHFEGAKLSSTLKVPDSSTQ
jgi:hypothetical protein